MGQKWQKLTAGAVVVALAGTSAVVVGSSLMASEAATPGEVALTGATAARATADDRRAPRADGWRGRWTGRQTTDDVGGRQLTRVNGRAPKHTGTWRNLSIVHGSTEQIAPGVTLSPFTATGGSYTEVAAGHYLTIDYATPGVQLDYSGPETVSETDPTSTMATADGAVAAVNGDFFDIGASGAPLGLGVDRDGGFKHGRESGWNAAFSIDASGQPQIGTLGVAIDVRGRGSIPLDRLNSPVVDKGRVGLYTKKWGGFPTDSIFPGKNGKVRSVWVRKGRGVVMNRKGLISPGGTLKGKVLIARGKAASRKLSRLKPGQKVRIDTAIAGSPQVAITGNKILHLGCTTTTSCEPPYRQVIDHVDIHPRTAVGIDRDNHRIILVVVDGRQAHSRGFTMVEMSNFLWQLGAEDALNLDGGGSSTMLARDAATGALRIRNSPSDGHERQVANALSVQFTGAWPVPWPPLPAPTATPTTTTPTPSPSCDVLTPCTTPPAAAAPAGALAAEPERSVPTLPVPTAPLASATP